MSAPWMLRTRITDVGDDARHVMAATMKPTPSKRKTADGAEPMATDEEMVCLIRAQDNNKKISATVRVRLHPKVAVRAVC